MDGADGTLNEATAVDWRSNSPQQTKHGLRHATFRHVARSILPPGRAISMRAVRNGPMCQGDALKLIYLLGTPSTAPIPTIGIQSNGSSISWPPPYYLKGREQ